VEGLNADTQTYLNTGFTITMWVRFLDKTSEGTLFNFGNPTRRDTSAFGFKLETYVIKGNDKPRKIAEAGQLEGEYISGFGTSAQNQGTWRQIFENGSFNGNTFEGQQNTSMYRGYRRLPQENFFQTTDTERFVRLVVREDGPDFRLRGSHTGMPFMARRMGLPEMGYQDQYSDTLSNGGMVDENDPSGIVQYDHTYGLMTNTLIPFDPTEWYFICASYNPSIDEDGSHQQTNISAQPVINNLSFDKSYWHNHRAIENTNPDDNPDMEAQYAANFTTLSNEGNRCKVEIISRSDLLRARGFKV